MAKQSDDKKRNGAQTGDRQERLRASLRANLLRRKEQARARAGQMPDAHDDSTGTGAGVDETGGDDS